ncbi:MAG TPA: hypothetical protein VN721_08750 [Flavipsychrobacter sp.]|nr:hypothetical protein [Flavipsychrobacter sp.]
MEIRDKNEWKSIQNALSQWENTGKLSHEKADELRQDIVYTTDRQQIAQYFFIIALSCTLLAFGAIFIDDKLLEKIKVYFDLNNIIIASVTTAISIFWFWYVHKRRERFSPFTYEMYMILGGLAALTSLVYICKEIGSGGAYTLFLFIATLLFFILSIWFRSKALWLAGILCLMGWYGAFSNLYSSNYLFLGMNYPMRFTAFGSLIIILSLLQSKIKILAANQRITYIAGLVVFFTGLWGISIFGNFNYLDEWEKVRQTHVLTYAIAFGAIAVFVFYLGIRYHDETTRDFGVLFLLVNLYTRYFEYFWDTMNKGIFFLILAVTFWFLGRWLEKKKRQNKQISGKSSSTMQQIS